ncbi:MAG: hypothetical protein JJE28_04655 [Actinomycetales bacterium]|nr:hypothetical protein [Actinomycetales bacterium]
MTERNTRDLSSLEAATRELALVDRIIGLEVEVARLSIEGGIKDIRILHTSRAWRVGRIVLMPFVLFRRLIRR